MRVCMPYAQAYLEDFYAYTQSLGGATAEVMGDILRVPGPARPPLPRSPPPPLPSACPDAPPLLA